MENRDRTARDIGRYVSGKVYPLQKSYLKAGVGGSEVRATLARLRHLDGSGPSSWMMVGCELFSGLPEFGISAADDERAIRTIISALSLYAVHQQSKMLPMQRLLLSVVLLAWGLFIRGTKDPLYMMWQTFTKQTPRYLSRFKWRPRSPTILVRPCGEAWVALDTICAPRVCGDDPVVAPAQQAHPECSPRMRG